MLMRQPPTTDRRLCSPHDKRHTHTHTRTLGVGGGVHGVHQLLDRGLQVSHLRARRVALPLELAHGRLLARGEAGEEALGGGGRPG